MKKIILSCAMLVLACSIGYASVIPKEHAKFLEDEDYKNAFERFSAVMKEAQERLDDNEYKGLEKENEQTILESVREDMASDYSELVAYATAYEMRNEYIGQVLVWDWLRKNAHGVQGYYRLKSDAFDGYMTIQEGEAGKIYGIYINVAQKADAMNSGEVNGFGKLDGKEMRVDDYGYEDTSATIDLIFDGETAHVKTSDAFKTSGWVGANVFIDGDYVREKK